MRKKISFVVTFAFIVSIIIYGCSKIGVNQTEIKQAINTNARGTVSLEQINSYFTTDELSCLIANFGEFDLSTLQISTVNDKTVTTICSKANDDYNFKKLVITEKINSDGIIQAIKDVVTIKSTSETMVQVVENQSPPSDNLEINIVCLNIGTLYRIDKNYGIFETQLGFNVNTASKFGACFKNCWAQRVLYMKHNLAAAAICLLAPPECAAAISAECAYECIFG